MKQHVARETLRQWRKRGKFLYIKSDLRKLFPHESEKTFSEGLRRLVKSQILLQPMRGLYLDAETPSDRSIELVEHIAILLRRGHYNYINLESALSEYGMISQIPIDRITVMTTGRKGCYTTAYGTIEFTHTKRPIKEILSSMQERNGPLRIATPKAALRDLKRVGRNTHLIIEESDT